MARKVPSESTISPVSKPILSTNQYASSDEPCQSGATVQAFMISSLSAQAFQNGIITTLILKYSTKLSFLHKKLILHIFWLLRDKYPISAW
jgi:hypothetical protein